MKPGAVNVPLTQKLGDQKTWDSKGPSFKCCMHPLHPPPPLQPTGAKPVGGAPAPILASSAVCGQIAPLYNTMLSWSFSIPNDEQQNRNVTVSKTEMLLLVSRNISVSKTKC